MSSSAHPFWWVNSGGRMVAADGHGGTMHADAPEGDKWRKAFAATHAEDTDGGLHPQNLFRLYTRQKFGDAAVSAYLREDHYYQSTSPNRRESNGLLLFARGAEDGQTMYYAGIRADGFYTIKRKKAGTYTTLAQVQCYPGKYDRDLAPDLLPHGNWIGLRLTCRNLTGLDQGKVKVSLEVDPRWYGHWTTIASMTDAAGQSITADGYAGIRTDFMDASFAHFSVAAA